MALLIKVQARIRGLIQRRKFNQTKAVKLGMQSAGRHTTNTERNYLNKIVDQKKSELGKFEYG